MTEIGTKKLQEALAYAERTGNHELAARTRRLIARNRPERTHLDGWPLLPGEGQLGR